MRVNTASNQTAAETKAKSSPKKIEDMTADEYQAARVGVFLGRVAKQVPLGFECRSCGPAAHNWLARIGRSLRGEPCCADMKSWIEKASADFSVKAP